MVLRDVHACVHLHVGMFPSQRHHGVHFLGLSYGSDSLWKKTSHSKAFLDLKLEKKKTL